MRRACQPGDTWNSSGNLTRTSGYVSPWPNTDSWADQKKRLTEENERLKERVEQLERSLVVPAEGLAEIRAMWPDALPGHTITTEHLAQFRGGRKAPDAE